MQLKSKSINDSINLAQQIIQVIEAAKQKLPYNINVIDELHANENAHSRILCKLLQYQDIEGRYRILESLLHYISSNKQEFLRISFDKPEITQEKERIDLWIRDQNTKFAIIFENKVQGAIDQDQQLGRYIDVTKRYGFKEENIFVVYLPADNHQPSKESWAGYENKFLERYANISFRDDIIPWLKEEVLPHCTIREEQLVSALRQYIDYLEGLFQLRVSQQKMYQMENLLKEIGVAGETFSEQLPEINKMMSQLAQAQKILNDYRAAHVKKIMDIFTKISMNILGETWRYKDSISNGNRWYFLYDTEWKTGSDVHLEWSGVGIEDLFVKKTPTYRIVLHVEGSHTKNEKYTQLLIKNLGELYKPENKTTFWSGVVDATTPIGEMSETALYEYLNAEVYNNPEISLVIAAINKTAKEYQEK